MSAISRGLSVSDAPGQESVRRLFPNPAGWQLFEPAGFEMGGHAEISGGRAMLDPLLMAVNPTGSAGF
jgi:hypothetical protein